MRLFSKHVDHRLSEYLDRRLAAAEAARVEEHVAGCTECGERLEGLRAAIEAIQVLPEVDVPRSFAVNEAMVRPVEAPRASRWQPYAAPAAGMAVVFVLLLGGDLATSIDSEDDADVAEDASQELLQMDELASEQAVGAERSSEAEAPAGEDDSAPADEQQDDGEFTEESTAEEPAEEELAPLADEDGDDSTTSEAGESAPAATPDPETIEQLEDVDEDDDDFRLFVRLIEAALAAGALALGFLAFRRWRASR